MLSGDILTEEISAGAKSLALGLPIFQYKTIYWKVIA